MTRVATPGLVGVELADRHPDIHPGDDLYRHMNERWAERHPIPADKARFGAFTVLAENAEVQVRAIAEAAVDATEGSEEHKVGALYRSFMDEDAIEKRGLEPLLERLRDLHHHSSSPDDLLVWMGGAERRGLSGLVQLFIDNDPGSPDRYIVFMEQDGLTLPDESYYRDDQFRDIRDALVAHMEKVFTFVGLSTPAERAQAVLEFETKLGSHHWDQVKCRDANATYNLRTWSDVTTLASGFDLERWAGAVGVSPEA